MALVRRLALLAGALVLPAAAAQADTILYHNDFETGTLDSGWSTAGRLDQSPAFTRFVGRYSENTATVLNNSVSLTLPPPQVVGTGGGEGGGTTTNQYSLSFDFYCIDSWDGNSTTNGPDLFEVYINSVNRFSYTFSNTAASQSYPFLPDVGPAYLGFNAADKDSIYRNITIPFSLPSDQNLIIKWRSNGLGGITDESWGIDNVTVSVVPAPGSVALLGLGCTTMLFRRRRR
jgi:hypothetical protein